MKDRGNRDGNEENGKRIGWICLDFCSVLFLGLENGVLSLETYGMNLLLITSAPYSPSSASVYQGWTGSNIPAGNKNAIQPRLKPSHSGHNVRAHD